MMLRLEQRAPEQSPATDRIVLAYDDRKRSRLRTQSERGRDVAIVLPRGSALRDGDRLLADNGEVFEIVAAPELVSEVRSSDARQLARAAYHLGNRHVPLQVEASCLRYLHDHVLDHMVEALGLGVTQRDAPFEPESGAYGAGYVHGHDQAGHVHEGESGHGHGHGHERDHEHEHEHEGHGVQRDWRRSTARNLVPHHIALPQHEHGRDEHDADGGEPDAPGHKGRSE